MAKPRPPKQQVGVSSVQSNNTGTVVAIVAGVIVALAVVAGAIALASKSKSTDTNAVEYRPVTSDDAALPVFNDQQTQTDDGVGKQAPALHGKDFDGKDVNITADGKPKVVMFFAHWCPHCQNEVPQLTNWIPVNRSHYPDVAFYAVSTNASPDKPNYPPSDWFKRENWPTPVIADDNNSDAGNAWGLASFPYILAVDGQDKVLARHSGEMTMADFGKFVAQAEQSAKTSGSTTSSTAAAAPAQAEPSTTATTTSKAG